MIEIIAILIAAGDGEHARTQDVGDAVGDAGRIARIGNHGCEFDGDAERLLDGGEQHHAAIGGDATPVEGGGDFLALNRWQRERQQGIFGHGGCGSVRFGSGWLRHPNLCVRSDAYATPASESLTCDE